MDKHETNGDYSAFPIPMDGEVLDAAIHWPRGFAKGLTKREYFAAMAMQGLCADHKNIIDGTSRAETAVQYADALIAALNEETS